MLETTLTTKFVPGTNLTGGLGCVDWRFLLPSQNLDNILCFGVPPAKTLTVLSAIAPLILVVADNLARLHEGHRHCKLAGLDNIHFICVKSLAQLPFSDRSVHLIHFVWFKKNAQIIRDHGMISECQRILRKDGLLFCEIQSVSAPLIYWNLTRNLSKQGFDGLESFWLTPLQGEFRTALPLKDGKLSRYFFANVMYGQSFKKRLLSRIGRMISSLGCIGWISPHRAISATRSSADNRLNPVPNYILEIAHQAGVDFSSCRCGLSTRAKYNANKVIFFIFNRNAKRPMAVVKMTRSKEFNQRLENEYRVLLELRKKGYVDRASFPEPLFFGYHNDLALLGITAVDGNPFRTQTDGTPNCPVAQDALNWICQLGGASANKTVADANDVSGVLNNLFKRFSRLYTLSEKQRDFLNQQIDTIGDHKGDFPIVFQHGDPGTWNIMVHKSGAITFIDWEAGEPQGMPLWDLFYYFRTYASWVSRMQGSRDSLKNFSQHFLSPSEIGSALIEATQRYCSIIGLDRELVKPLFYTCWMHRALKEATRLTQASLDSGHYVNVLKCAINQSNASSPLKKLFLLN
jgi:hypothetical protein